MADTVNKKATKEKYIVCLGVGLLVGLVFCGLSFTNLIESLELKSLNYLFNQRGNTEITDELIIAEIDEPMVKRLGYPIPRKYEALLINALSKAGVKAIGFDIIFD